MGMPFITTIRHGETMPDLTVDQAYDAMLVFLEREYRLTGSEDLAALLGSLSRNIWSDGSPNDPAAWNDWLSAVEAVRLKRES